MWGGLQQIATYHDESANLLQGRIFASWQAVAAPRPVPAFFEQYHVFVYPVLAAKYPPGYSLLLVPGIWIGLPGLIPAVLSGIGATVMFVLARRVTNGAVALLTTSLAATSDIALRFNPSYFSEVATAAFFLVGWLALHEYWERGRRRWLIVLGLTVAWGALTRPLTMLAFSLPAAVAALLSVRRHRAWGDALFALGISLAVIAIMPLWNARVTGDWRVSGYSAYARLFIPADRMGFGVNPALPLAALSKEQRDFDQWVRDVHSVHERDSLPSIAVERAASLAWGSWHRGLFAGILAAIGILFVPAAIARVVVATVSCVFAAYLLYAHPPEWNLYYLELQPPLAFLTAAGGFEVARWASRGIERVALLSKRHFPWSTGNRRNEFRTFTFAIIAIWLLAPAGSAVLRQRLVAVQRRSYREKFFRAVAGLPQVPSIVFVRYASGHSPHNSLVDNVVDLHTARIWIVHDLGYANTRLMSLAPDRRAYLYTERIQDARIVGSFERLSGATADAVKESATPAP